MTLTSKVTLLVYDLSQGMAKTMSMGLVGKQIDGIWHTAVVVYGKEYCFGQGIEILSPGHSHYGTPVQSIDMGETQIPLEIFSEYMDHMMTVWTADKYHLLDNNCNSFSDEVCQFLVGTGIPSHITGLPAEFLNTPFGQMLRPMIEAQFGPSSHSNNSHFDSSSNKSITPANPATMVRPCTSLPELKALIASHKCVVVDFTSQNCGPCRIISPEFDRMIQDANSQSLNSSEITHTKILGLSVESSVARDISSFYQIAATPTFKFFLDGKETNEIMGADRAELKSCIDILLFTAYPPHRHSKLKLDSLKSLCRSAPVHFVTSSNLDGIFKKLKNFINESKVECSLSRLDDVFEWTKHQDVKKTVFDPLGFETISTP